MLLLKHISSNNSNNMAKKLIANYLDNLHNIETSEILVFGLPDTNYASTRLECNDPLSLDMHGSRHITSSTGGRPLCFGISGPIENPELVTVDGRFFSCRTGKIFDYPVRKNYIK